MEAPIPTSDRRDGQPAPPSEDAERREQAARSGAKRESWLEQLLQALRLSKGRPTPRWKE